MSDVNFIFDGNQKKVDAPKGKSLLTIAQDNEVPMRSSCGGNGCCTTCMVEVRSGSENLNEMTEAEKQMMLPDDGQTRLGCQAKLRKDLADGADEVSVELIM